LSLNIRGHIGRLGRHPIIDAEVQSGGMTMQTLRFGTVAGLGLLLVGCMASGETPKLVAVSSNVGYTPAQVHAICYSESLNVQAAVKASSPPPTTRPRRYQTSCMEIGGIVRCDSEPSGGFAEGFADSFERSFSRRSGTRERRAAYDACAAQHGYLREG